MLIDALFLVSGIALALTCLAYGLGVEKSGRWW